MDAELRQDLLVALAEGAHLVAQQVQRAQHPFLVPERHDELRVHSRDQAEIPRILMDVVHQDGPLLRHRGTDDALADLEAEVQHHVERIAFGVRDLQLLPLVVEHVDGEHRERRQPGDEPRNALQQLVDVEHRRHFAPELEQRGDKFLILGSGDGFRHYSRSCTASRLAEATASLAKARVHLTMRRGWPDRYNISPDGTADAAARLRGD